MVNSAKRAASLKPTGVVVGIDLGTTRSVIAHVDASGKPRTILNSEGELTTASMVLFEDSGVTVGKEAVKALAVLPDQVAMYAKREMGNDSYSQAVNGQHYSPEMIQSFVLGKLRRDAEAKLGCEIQHAVITVPAYFNEPKRRATMDAGLLAGLDVRAVINEPTAAAIAFGMEQQSRAAGPQTVLVYDLGGGTFDASIVRIEGNQFNVLATDGNVLLGGLDWDHCLTKWIDSQFSLEHSIQPSTMPGGNAFLCREAEEIKHSLTSRKQIDVRLNFQGHSLQHTISREEFEDMTAHLLDRTRFTIRKLVADANLNWIEIDRILLVGGSTRMPQIREMLLKESGIVADGSLSADEVVAHGAALYALSLDVREEEDSSTKTVKITDVNAHHLGVLGVEKRTGRRLRHIMIPRNTPLPASKVTRFETVRDNQPSVAVEVIEGGDASGRNATKIGRCVIGGLPPDLVAGTAVDVSFRYDSDGLIHVAAVVPSSGQKASLTINRAAGLSDEELSTMRDIHLALGLDD